MENTEMLAIYDKEVRRECERTRKRRQVLPQLVRYTPVDEGSSGSFICWSDLIADSADVAIQNQIDTFRELNTDFEWIYYSYDLPTDLPRRLLTFGFTAKKPLAKFSQKSPTVQEPLSSRGSKPAAGSCIGCVKRLQ
jgi:hypothetical protein